VYRGRNHKTASQPESEFQVHFLAPISNILIELGSVNWDLIVLPHSLVFIYSFSLRNNRDAGKMIALHIAFELKPGSINSDSVVPNRISLILGHTTSISEIYGK